VAIMSEADAILAPRVFLNEIARHMGMDCALLPHSKMLLIAGRFGQKVMEITAVLFPSLARRNVALRDSHQCFCASMLSVLDRVRSMLADAAMPTPRRFARL
jgi:hypothetical protein